MKRALITGGAGFIGSHLTDRLLQESWHVTVVDNLDPFYDPAAKLSNVSSHSQDANFTLVRADIRDHEELASRLPGDYDVIVHLAAKAGVRPSIIDPLAYQEVNVIGTQNLLELARQRGIRQFVFASSSSVYGVNPDVPWREDDHVLLPISPYASSKVSGELLGHVYSHLYGIRFIALRFFTVYGPRQRPDLAIHKFMRLMLDGKPVPVFGNGTSRRDFTYVADIVQGIRAAIDYHDTAYQAINLGNNRTVSVIEMIHALERISGIKANIEFLPEQPGDLPLTFADVAKAHALLDYKLQTNFETGLGKFYAWLICPPQSAAAIR